MDNKKQTAASEFRGTLTFVGVILVLIIIAGAFSVFGKRNDAPLPSCFDEAAKAKARPGDKCSVVH